MFRFQSDFTRRMSLPMPTWPKPAEAVTSPSTFHVVPQRGAGLYPDSMDSMNHPMQALGYDQASLVT